MTSTQQHPAAATLPAVGFVRASQLVQGILPFSRSTLWAKVAEKTFPAPLKLGPRITAWRVEDVRAWIESQQATV